MHWNATLRDLHDLQFTVYFRTSGGYLHCTRITNSVENNSYIKQRLLRKGNGAKQSRRTRCICRHLKKNRLEIPTLKWLVIFALSSGSILTML